VIPPRDNPVEPPPVSRQSVLADAIQHQVNCLLERDRLFERNQRALRSQYTAGAISAPTFHAIRAWQIGDVVRRHGLPLVVTRAYLRVAGACS